MCIIDRTYSEIQVKLAGGFLVKIEKIGGENKQMQDDRIKKALAGKTEATGISGVVQLKPAFFVVVPKIPGDGHEVGELPGKENPE